MLMRLYDPNTGKITINGADLKDMSPRHLHENIGVVFQDSFLFAGTIYDNVAYGKPNATPEEVIAAAGFHPLRIIGRHEVSSPPHQSLYTPVCSFARNLYAAAVSGGFSFASHVIFPNSCDSLKVLQQVWGAHQTRPPLHVLLHPVRADEVSVQYFAEQIEMLAQKLMAESGLRFTDSQLTDHIQRYNQTRQWLRTLYAGPSLKGSERIILVTAGMIMNRDEYNQTLRQVVPEVPPTGSSSPDAGKRIMMIGPLVDNVELVETIEQLGATIVGDDITNGSRYCDLDVELGGNPYENLARRYLRSGPSPTMNADGDNEVGRLRRRVRGLNPDGVIFAIQKFCEPHIHNYLSKRQVLAEMNVNTLMLALEHDEAAVGAHDRLRIEAFLETLGRS
jgi:benzoyl-CoA reductase/2-hydroxyglutaryl-CoA dehydratase subunit BcrC/BadD/HgdB